MFIQNRLLQVQQKYSTEIAPADALIPTSNEPTSKQQIAPTTHDDRAVARTLGQERLTPKFADATQNALSVRLNSVRTFSLEAVTFDDATAVVPSQDRLKASRFSLPIPAFAGGPLVHPSHYPVDMRDKDGTPHAQAGQPLPDDIRGKPLQKWDGKPITRADGSAATGVVFFNYEDQKFQAMQDTGDKIFLFNRPSPEQGAQLQAYVESNGGPAALRTASAIVDVLAFAKSIGLDDRYDSDLKYAKGKLTTTKDQSTGVEAFGMHMRANEMVKAVFVDGPVQVADVRLGKEGGVFLLVSEKDGQRELRHVTPSAFAETYTAATGAAIDATELSTLVLSELR
jgi:hypothetical protein